MKYTVLKTTKPQPSTSLTRGTFKTPAPLALWWHTPAVPARGRLSGRTSRSLSIARTTQQEQISKNKQTNKQDVSSFFIISMSFPTLGWEAWTLSTPIRVMVLTSFEIKIGLCLAVQTRWRKNFEMFLPRNPNSKSQDSEDTFFSVSFSAGYRTQGHIHARQVLYYSAVLSAPCAHFRVTEMIMHYSIFNFTSLKWQKLVLSSF